MILSLLRAIPALALCLWLVACSSSSSSGPTPTPQATAIQTPAQVLALAQDKIKHVVIIMQENRSFDSYFGTFPGADGIPMANGVPAVCLPDDTTGQCVAPYHDTSLLNAGGPHSFPDTPLDVDGGKMDGFVNEQRTACAGGPGPDCGKVITTPDAMGYHTADEIPNYWTYAQQFVLQDHMFPSVASWSQPVHLYMVSAWSAVCSVQDDPSSCTNEPNSPDAPPDFQTSQRAAPDGSVPRPNYAWTDITYLLHKYGVSWSYYVAEGTQLGAENDCEDEDEPCIPSSQQNGTPGIWNPLLWFSTVGQDDQLANVQTLSHFYDAAKNGTLPAVSWIVPDGPDSEHPYWQAPITQGQAYVTNLINTIMQGPDWDSTAIFLAWDDWGGFYDNVVPPVVDGNGYGIRVPGLVISPYAKQGYVDHQTLSFDAYLKFIEDIFMNGQRIDPNTDGRPDPRPDVRENASILGDLLQDFDFSQQPRAPVILNPQPLPVATTTPVAPAG